MNSISLNIVKNILNNKRYDIITEFAHTEFPEKNDLVIFEYTGKDVRAYKDAQNRTCIMCPKNMTVTQEGHVAEAIARGTIFDDAEEINNNAEFIEKTSIPHAALINSGKNTPTKLKPMIAIVIGRMKDDGTFEIGDAERINGNNFVRDLIHHKDKGCTISEVIGNYIDKDPNEYHNIELGRDINDLHKEIEDINDTEFENTITDDDIVDSYDDIDIEALEADPFEKNEETTEQEPESDDPDDDDDDNDNTDPDDDNDDIITDDEPETDDDELPVKEELNDESYQEGFLSKKPKKLKPIPRDIIAYITVEMNDITSANDQAMLSGYTCSKIELVDFYLTVLDTQDPRYIVPHNKEYLTYMKRELERLLTQILRIRPINRMDKVWRVNVNCPEDWRS